MPRFSPFPGLRYALSQIGSLDEVVCPPYDVISEEERSELLARSALNIVGVELPVGPEAYGAARRLLDAWREAGILVRDPAPVFYGYRMSYKDAAGEARSTLGVIGSLALEPPGDGILPHEHTTPKAKSDRLDLLRACRANVSPIWVLSPAGGLSSALTPPERPVGRATDDDGVVHECWPITDEAQQRRIEGLVSSGPVLVADGHHRYEVALAYQQEQAAQGAGPGDHDAVMALAVELADDQLAVQPIHRLISGLPDGFDFLAAFEEHFELTPAEPPDATIQARLVREGAMAVLTGQGTWFARARPATSKAAAHDLDTSRLDVALAAMPTHEIAYQHGWDLALAAVRRGEAQAAVLVRPATVAQIAAISRGGERMPPKTTFFWPKPRTGMVIRELVD